jgi:hypothetical protein
MPKTENMNMKRMALAVATILLAVPLPVFASEAYGSLNNFDVVNDTGEPCHGFEIEIEDIHSRDITYTYDWNHYGVPRITEDDSDPLHPRVNIYYEAKKNEDGSWSAYTAVPEGPVAPTDGHQFIDPSVNFGGEHFGAGFYGNPTTVRYFWLRDDGFGNLVRGNPVYIATPAFSYGPPPGGGAVQVQAVIEPPEPPEIPVKEFGEATWVKVTRTETHNDNRVELRDLVSDDPEDPDDRNWRNGEPDEVEIEWQLLQTEFKHADGGNNGVIENEPQELPDGDEIITVRYDFFKYVGPLDPESGEAATDNVGPDDLHGIGIEEIEGIEVDMSTVVVVGDYIGAQMAGFDAAGQIGLIDNLQDGEVYAPYVERRVVIAGVPPITTEVTGELPEGMEFDAVEGVLSGVPLTAGVFAFSVHSTDSNGGDVTKDYELVISDGIEGEGAFEGEGSLEGEGSPEGVIEGSLEGEGSPEGVIEGSLEGEGSTEGVSEGALEGEGSAEGVSEGALEGEGAPEGVVEGSFEGEGEGSVEGVSEGEGEGSIEGALEGEGASEGESMDDASQLLQAFADSDTDDDGGLSLAEAQALLAGLSESDYLLLDTNADGYVNVAELLAAAGGNVIIHSGDADGDHAVSLNELLRVIQLYNAGGYTCLENPGDSEDGYNRSPPRSLSRPARDATVCRRVPYEGYRSPP